MGRYSNEFGESGFEILGLVPAEPSPSPLAAPDVPAVAPQWSFGAQPLTRREARERGDVAADAQPVTAAPTSGHALLFPEYTAHRITPPVELPARSRSSRPEAKRSAPPRPPSATKRELRRLSRGTSGPAKRKARTPSKMLSLGAMLFAAALVVGMSVPANAFMGDSSRLAATSLASSTTAAQTLAVSADSDPTTISRDGFSVVSYQDLMAAAGHTGGTFTPTTGAIRWPFPYTVPVSDGFGPREAPCDGCSTFHQGVDFTPGTGTPIYAIADGIVESHSGDGSWVSFGNNVVIQHNIPGQNVESLYAHMITGSSTLQPGDVIKVGDFIGLVGDTGSSAGAHLHLEIHIDKVPVDPFAWLQANATNVP